MLIDTDVFIWHMRGNTAARDMLDNLDGMKISAGAHPPGKGADDPGLRNQTAKAAAGDRRG